MLKLYKSTVTVCFWIAIFCIILSIPMEIYQFSIIENYAIGIACSCFVVIVTTALQLHKEQKETESKMFAAVEKTLFYIQFALPDKEGKDLSIRQYNYVFELLSNTITEARKTVSDLCLINKKKYLELWQAIARMELEFLKSAPYQEKAAVQNVAKGVVITPVVDAYLSFNTTNNMFKESIQKMQEELSDF